MTNTDVLPDDAALRVARRERVLAEMEAADVDVLVVGREANARYVSGVPRLWLAGTRPYGPGCVLVRETGAVHLLSTWDEGVPEDIPHENLYGYTFNAATFLTVLSGIDGAATARTVATDALNPAATGLLPTSFPAATIVDGEQVLQRARRVKTPEELVALRASTALTERCLAAAMSSLEPGATERRLTGVFMEEMANAGICTPSIQDVAWITSRTHRWHRAGRDAAVVAGDLVAFEGGVMVDGYAAEIGRTGAVGDIADGLFSRTRELWDRLVDGCRPGAPFTALLDAYDDAGVAPPPMPIARGLGLGYDYPVVTHALPETAASGSLEAGMVLALAAYVWEEGQGAVYCQEPVVITDDGPELLATTPFFES